MTVHKEDISLVDLFSYILSGKLPNIYLGLWISDLVWGFIEADILVTSENFSFIYLVMMMIAPNCLVH